MTEIINRIHQLTELKDDAMQFGDERTADLITAIRNAHAAEQPAATATDIGAAVREALQGIELVVVEPIVIDNGDLGEQLITDAERRVITRIKNDPYSILPRAA